MWNALYTAEKVIIRWTLLTEACYFGVQSVGEWYRVGRLARYRRKGTELGDTLKHIPVPRLLTQGCALLGTCHLGAAD